MTDPVPPAARTELRRLAGRWHQLPIGQALPSASTVRELAQRYADQVADAIGLPCGPLPDLGPAVVIDQLTVTVYDACRLAATAGNGDAAAAEMSDALAQLRQGIG